MIVKYVLFDLVGTLVRFSAGTTGTFRAACQSAQARADRTEATCPAPQAGLLGLLRERGYKLGLVSDTALDPETARRAVEHLGLAECFDALVFSNQVEAGQPRTGLFRAALEQLGADPGQAAYIGDSLEADIQGAAAVGLKTIWLRPEAGRAGEVADGDIADASVAALDEVPAILEGWLRQEFQRAEDLRDHGLAQLELAYHEGFVHLEAAESALAEAETIYRLAGATTPLIGLLSGRAAVARARGGAEELARAAVWLADEVSLLLAAGRDDEALLARGELSGVYWQLAVADPAHCLDYLELGIKLASSSLEAARKRELPQVAAKCAINLARLLAALANADRAEAQEHRRSARELARLTVELARERDPEEAAAARLLEAELILAGTGPEAANEAEGLLQQAEELIMGGQTGRYWLGQLYATRARLAAVNGNVQEAEGFALQAQRILDRFQDS
ncbi:MAG: HAD family hydrolase [Bacillota bacterium]